MKKFSSLIELDVLLHYISSPYEHPDIDVIPIRKAINKLTSDGILQEDITSQDDSGRKPSSYSVTERGRLWVDLLLSVPYPMKAEVWVDQKGEVIQFTHHD